ncbi:MAG TPA: N-acetylmuramoyl-L-alanine amidase [Ktedonobacteraceae bacterium]|nr:N-acetylmuramoyl-L-alanine amidase [Ktedonobacteraceae bacterium]
MQKRILLKNLVFPISFVLVLLVGMMNGLAVKQAMAAGGSANWAFNQASKESGVPMSILKALCYMEGHLSNHRGTASRDNGYGCMHLVKNMHGDTLDSAAHDLGVSEDQLKRDLATNIRGGAAILRDEALQLASNHLLPAYLADWYGALAAYSHASTKSVARMYADEVYRLLEIGFTAMTDTGELVSLPAQAVQPNVTTAAGVKTASTLPNGCSNDGKTDYPGAIDCIVPSSFDCNTVTGNNPCTYESANRPGDLAIDFVTIHDIEGTVQDAFNAFQDINSSVSIHYVVDTDGTVYQLLREKDIAYHAGNYWYNQHAIGIEHAGFDATGFLWYNAAEYMGSARLVAYLLKKYRLPPDHDHVVGHGTIPSPAAKYRPNHVDPGPYWLWDYYFWLIWQDLAFNMKWHNNHIITLHPRTDLLPLGGGGAESPANFNFFYLYNGPSTQSGLIPQVGSGSDVTDETNNVEPDISYYYLDKVRDPAGTGDMLYEVWYGEADHAHDATPSQFANAKLVWLAVPPSAAFMGEGQLVMLNLSGATSAKVYGDPITDDAYQIGDASNGAIFVSALTAIEDGTTNLWYEINYNHRQAWVPATEVTVVP